MSDPNLPESVAPEDLAEWLLWVWGNNQDLQLAISEVEWNGFMENIESIE